jgi:hypothetical protein
MKRLIGGLMLLAPLAVQTVFGQVQLTREGYGGKYFVGAPIRYVERNPMPPLTPEQQGRGYILFRRPYVELVFPNTIPAKEEIITQPIRIFATPGEYEPITISLLPLRDLKGVRVEVAPFLADGYRGRLDRSMVEVRKVRYLQRAEALRGGRPMLVPLVLERGEYWDIPKGETSRFYVTVHVSEATPPGLYRGRIIVIEGQWNSQIIDVELDILPFHLEEPPGISWGMTNYEESKETYREIFADQRAHGMNTVKFEQILGNRMRIENGKVNVDFDGNGFLERIADIYKEFDFSRPMMWAMSGEPEGHYDPYTPGNVLLLGDIIDWCMEQAAGDEQSQMFEFCYRGVVQAVLDESAKRGWQPMIWQPCNEPLGHPWDLQDRTTKRTLEILKSMGLTTEINGMVVGGPGPYDKSFPNRLMNDLYPLIDIFAIHDGPFVDRGFYDPVSWAQFSERRKRDGGKKLWFYNFDITGYYPEASRFAYGYGVWIAKADGVMQWTYRRLDQLPDMPDGIPRYEDPAALCFSYPQTERQKGGPTTAYEAIREGVDDYKYLYKFYQTIDQVTKFGSASARKRAEELQKGMDTKLAQLSFEKLSKRPHGVWSEPLKNGPDGVGEVAGKYKMPDGWSFEDYDLVRKQAAYGTAELLKLLNPEHKEPEPLKPFYKYVKRPR